MKKVVQTVLIIIILAMSGHIVISNIEHIIYLNTKTYTYNFQKDSSIISIKDSINNIEDNLEKINKLENSYLTNSELNNIKMYLAENLTKIRTLDFLSYGPDKNVMTQKELFEVMESVFKIDVVGNIEAYRTLAKNNTNLNVEQFIEYNYMLMVYADYISRPIIDNYKYQHFNINAEKVDLTVNNFMNFALIRINAIECLSRLVLESGDISE